MTARRRASAFCLSLLMLAGCDSLSVRAVGTQTTLYERNDLDYAGGGRELLVVVLDDGATLGGHERLQQAALAQMQDIIGARTSLSAAPQNYDKDFKAVLLFNPAPGIAAARLCRESGGFPFVTNAGDAMHVQGVFCRAGELLTETDVYTSGLPSTGTPRFRELMKAVTTGVFPSNDLRIGAAPRD